MSGKINKYVYLLLALLLSYSPILMTKHPVNPDAQFIIPDLTSSSGISSYVGKLISFRTIDVQPVRDLSFLADIMIHDLTGLNSFVWINLLLWWISGILLFRIMQILFNHIPEESIYLLIACFLLYPLFSQTVAWGMARKHLLSFVFILAGTECWLKEKKRCSLFYALSVFSQPITLLWPVWAFIQKPKAWKLLIPSIAIMIFAVFINYRYYNESEIFRSFYGTKTNELFALPEKILALGHYVFQLFFPYLLSNTYGLGHWASLIGLPLAVLFIFFILKRKVNPRFVLSWGIFFILPLLIVVSQATSIYDTYLLVPGAAFLILLTSTLREKISTAVLVSLAIVWGSLTFYESIKWRDEFTLTSRSFSRRPDCRTAFQHARSSYEWGKLPDREALSFLRDYDCSKLSVSSQHRINLEASILFYEEGPPAERITKLRTLSTYGIYPQLALAALFIKNENSEEARQTLSEIQSRWGKMRFRDEFIPFVSEVILPFCRKDSNENCLETIGPFIKMPQGLSYR